MRGELGGGLLPVRQHAVQVLHQRRRVVRYQQPQQAVRHSQASLLDRGLRIGLM